MIPIGILAFARKPNITAVESTLWSGGSNSGPGARVIKYTSDTLIADTTYTVTIGAANTNSSALGRTAVVSGTVSSTNINGVSTTYSTTGGTASIPSGTVINGRYRYMATAYAYGGKPGAASNGGSGSTLPTSYTWFGGNGGTSYAGVTSIGLAGFPVTGVGAGGSGNYTTSVPIRDNFTGQIVFYAYGNNGQSNPFGANTGNGFGSNGTLQAGSGGMTLKYADTQPVLTSTTGTVTYLNSGGFHNYFWKSTGSFTV